jgi:tetratricopeptide (TPR) repeat protein
MALIPVLLAFAAYLPVFNNEFVWDDLAYIRDNPNLRSFTGSHIQWMLTSFLGGNWMPLTRLSLAFDYLLGGASPKIYHFTNLLLHGANTYLVFFLSLAVLRLASKNLSLGMEKAGAGWMKGAAWMTAVLFALHPTQVETAAWAVERSNLLCALFFFLSLRTYLDYASGVGSRRKKYMACLGYFCLAITAKPFAVTLPVVLLLLDHWPLGRMKKGFRSVLAEKIPFLAVSFIAGLVAIAAQSDASALIPLQTLPPDARFWNAFHAVAFYLWKLVWPANLAVFYPVTLKTESPSLENVLALLLFFSISYLCYRQRKARPYLSVVWLYFLVTLAPVLGIFQIGSQFAADRYLYFSSFAFYLLFAAALAIFLARRGTSWMPSAAILAGVLGYATLLQVGTWSDSITLWEKAVEVSPHASGLAYANLAQAYEDRQLLDEALKAWDEALAIGPVDSIKLEGKGLTLLQKGRAEEAAKIFRSDLVLDPKNPIAHRCMFLALQSVGKLQEALPEAQEAVRLSPAFPLGYNYLGTCYFGLNQTDLAAENFQKAVSLDPQNTIYLGNLASAYMSLDRYRDAVQIYQEALSYKPQDPGLSQRLETALEKLNEVKDLRH